MEHFAFKYRQRSKEMAQGKNDQVARTQLRLDTMREGLLLGIRETKEASWEFYRKKDLPDLESTSEEESSGDEMEEEEPEEY